MAVEVVSVVYECPGCGERLLDRRCPANSVPVHDRDIGGAHVRL
jgi:hypothetical protein